MSSRLDQSEGPEVARVKECAEHNGCYVIDTSDLPPAPWRTGWLDYEDDQRRVAGCYPIFWQGNMQEGLDALYEIIRKFKDKHQEELAEAEEYRVHALENLGELDDPSEIDTWPVADQLEWLEFLHDSWSKEFKQRRAETPKA